MDQGDDDAYTKQINVPTSGPADEPFVRDTIGSRKDVPVERLCTRAMLTSGAGADIADEVCTSKGRGERREGSPIVWINHEEPRLLRKCSRF
jgi:hypothetical protein